MHAVSVLLQALVAGSTLFVWVVRYENIVEEFKHYRLPDWLRDLVGVLKVTFSILLLAGIQQSVFAVMGALGIAGLMGCAFVVHLRVKNPFAKMLPCLALLGISLAIVALNYPLIAT
jgi:uncharacterized membrane protein YphA (DoxX/SURF4 family)